MRIALVNLTLGSKNLKAIYAHSVAHANTIPEFAAVSKRIGKHLMTDPQLSALIADGTVFLMHPKNLRARRFQPRR